MSNLSGYDSEAIGFDSVTQNENSESHSGTQTSEFSECMTGSQTYTFQDYACNVTPADLDTGRETTQFSTVGLNEFLRRVVPSMMDQLDQSTSEVLYNSSESDEEEICAAKLFQEFKLTDGIPFQGAGDQENSSILSLTWSSAGNSLAVSLGRAQHDTWCEHEGLIRIYTMKRSKCDSLVHSIDITEKNCITVVRFHPGVAAILAYGTNSGEIVICNLQNITSGFNQTMQLASPSGFHGSIRVSALQWADAALTNEFILMQITNTGKRRGAADQVLISSGSDGTVNVWQVNVHLQIFQNIVSYKIDGARKTEALNISCFDFMKVCPLSQPREPICEDIFVAGTTCGKLYLCSVKNYQKLLESEMVDPVYEVLEGHGTCVLDVAFSSQKPGIFASLSMDSELRVFDVKETAPLMVLCMESPLSCISWVPMHPCLVVVGLTSPDKNGQVLQLWNVASGRAVHLEGLTDSDRNAAVTITSLAINQSGACRVAAGDANGRVKIWDMPFNRLKIAPEQYEF